MMPLTGFTIGVTGHRRASEQADMLAKRGATVVIGSVMQSVPLEDIEATTTATRRVIEGPVDCFVLTTGVGTRSWMGVAEMAGIDDELRAASRAALVLARGPKARSAGIAAGFEVSWQAPGETGAEIVAHLAELGVAGKRIAVQRDGAADHAQTLCASIATLGADVVEVPVYRWKLPDDPQPARRLIAALAAGRLDAVTFTSAVAVDNFFQLVADQGVDRTTLWRRAVAVAVGPVTGHALRHHGCSTPVEPPRARLGSMIQALVTTLAQRAEVLSFAGVAVHRQGLAIEVEGSAPTSLTRREAFLLDELLRRAPAVVAKTELVEAGADIHAAEMAVTRLRAKLGEVGEGIVAVPRRGYRCVIETGPPEPHPAP